MADVWLRTNQRAIVITMLPVALVGLAGLAAAVGAFGTIESVWIRGGGGLLIVVAVGVTVMLALELRRPRLAYDAGCLVLHLKRGPAVRVPIDVVEAFFSGQAPAYLPGRGPDARKTATVVIRLAERASEWSQRDVEPALGHWCDGYITVRGTWCEPLTAELVRTLNCRLDEVKRKTSRSESS